MFVETHFYMVIRIYPWSLLFASLVSEKTVSHCFGFHSTDYLGGRARFYMFVSLCISSSANDLFIHFTHLKKNSGLCLFKKAIVGFLHLVGILPLFCRLYY